MQVGSDDGHGIKAPVHATLGNPQAGITVQIVEQTLLYPHPKQDGGICAHLFSTLKDTHLVNINGKLICSSVEGQELVPITG